MRLMALDWGLRRIGVAVSDDLGIAVHGLPTLVRRNIRSDLDALTRLVRERNIELVVVGQPLHIDGAPSRSSDQAARFGRRLAKSAGVRVEMHDERLTSWESRQGSRSRPRKPGEIDRRAAVLLLESYLAASQG